MSKGRVFDILVIKPKIEGNLGIENPIEAKT